MTFNDVLKSSFLESVSSFSIVDTLLALALSFIMGLIIFLVYRTTYSGVMYSTGFAVSLIAMSTVTALVILAVSSNVVLSLGMVGALSIVRFRAAVKDPIDIAYLFWSIAQGIVFGAGMIPLGIIGGVIIAVIMLIFTNKKTTDAPYILVVNCQDDEAEKNAKQTVKENTKKFLEKSKTVAKGNIELTVEVRLSGGESDFVNKVAELPGITNAVLVSYNGEFLA